MKIAILTGAGSGLGRACIPYLTACGAEEFWLLSRTESALSAAATENPSLPCRLFPLDLTAPGAIPTLRAALDEAGAEVIFLVTAAGVGYTGAFLSLPEARHREVLSLNCLSLSSLLYAVLPYMAAGGRILNFASAAAFLPQPGFSLYAASKAYVLSLSRALSREVRARGITVTAACPGPTATPFLEKMQKGSPMPAWKKKFILPPEKVARTALRGAMRGRSVVVPGFFNKLVHVAAKLLPHGLLLYFFKYEQKDDPV